MLQCCAHVAHTTCQLIACVIARVFLFLLLLLFFLGSTRQLGWDLRRNRHSYRGRRSEKNGLAPSSAAIKNLKARFTCRWCLGGQSLGSSGRRGIGGKRRGSNRGLACFCREDMLSSTLKSVLRFASYIYRMVASHSAQDDCRSCLCCV